MELINKFVNLINRFRLRKDTMLTRSMIESTLKPFEKNLKTVEIMDNFYYSSDTTDVVDFMKTFIFQYLRYESSKRDCDDFSFALFGYKQALSGNYAIGVVHVDTNGDKHSLNFFIDAKCKFWYIEPQTGEVLDTKHPKVQSYRPYLIII